MLKLYEEVTAMEKSISDNIRYLRSLKKYTQKEFASLLGVAQTTVANYENGLRVPDAQKLQKIADIFEVSLDYLLGRESRKENSSIIQKKLSLINNKEESFKIYLNLLLQGKGTDARGFVIGLYHQGLPMKSIYFDIFEKALKEVGTFWESGKIDVWQEHFISEVTMDLMREIKSKEQRKKKNLCYVMGVTAGAELHNIGLKMILDTLEIEGGKSLYLGSNVPVQSLVNAVKSEKPDLLAISVTIDHHIESVKYMIEAIRENVKGKLPKIVVGGGAFKNNPKLWQSTGADQYSDSVEDLISFINN